MLCGEARVNDLPLTDLAGAPCNVRWAAPSYSVCNTPQADTCTSAHAHQNSTREQNNKQRSARTVGWGGNTDADGTVL